MYNEYNSNIKFATMPTFGNKYKMSYWKCVAANNKLLHTIILKQNQK